MELKPLGNTGVMVPEIGLGTWKYRGGVEPLHRGIELGAFLLDTAEIYGTEGIVGQAIQGLRERVFVATKVSGAHLRHDEVLRAAEASVQRLGVEVIDLYQIHWPNARVPLTETMRAMEVLVDRGQVRFIGVSNFSLRELRAAQQGMRHYPIVANQVLYNLKQREIEHELLPYCQEQQITVLAYTPLDDGRLATTARVRRKPHERVLEEVAAEVQKTVAQVALNWCTTHPCVIAIPKSNSVERTVENCRASDWHLTASQMQRLDAAFM